MVCEEGRRHNRYDAIFENNRNKAFWLIYVRYHHLQQYRFLVTIVSAVPLAISSVDRVTRNWVIQGLALNVWNFLQLTWRPPHRASGNPGACRAG